jgi:hypothetical protein
VSIRKGTDIRFFIESVSPISGNKEVSNFNTNSDIWCVTMSSTLGVNETAKQKFTIGPNPSTGVFSFEGLADLSGQLRIQVSNTYGQIVWEESITDANQQFTIERPGLYLVSILENDQMVQTVRLLRY